MQAPAGHRARQRPGPDQTQALLRQQHQKASPASQTATAAHLWALPLLLSAGQRDPPALLLLLLVVLRGVGQTRLTPAQQRGQQQHPPPQPGLQQQQVQGRHPNQLGCRCRLAALLPRLLP
jgi:hypothetical protein